MGEHFVLLVDRLITETTLEAVIESRNKSTISEIDLKVEVALPMNSGDFKGEGKLVECRICQEEDEDCNLETPCSCCGSLKYAHRKCVQKWCNEKGDTMCEICLQQFKPGYTAPPKLFHYGRIPMSFRGNWEITRRDIQNRSFITMVPNSRDFIGSSNYDDYASSNMRSGIYCRIVAIIFMVLLTLRHILPIITSGVEQYPLPLLALWLLGTAGIVLPVYVMMMAVTTFHRSRLQQNLNETANLETDEENADQQLSQSTRTT